MKTTSLITLVLSFTLLSSIRCVAAESIEGDYEAAVFRNCWPSEENYTPQGCKVKEGIKIQRRNKSSYYLWVHTEADFGHFCSYRGIAHMENGALVSKSNDCTVSVKWLDDVANVQSFGEGCGPNFCGANTYLDASGLKKKTGLTQRSSGTAQERAAP